MMMWMEKLAYLVESAAKWGVRVGIGCPSCGGRPEQVLDRKYLVTQLRRCDKCGLIYRTPTGNPSRMATFYERRYMQGFTTDLPLDHELEKLLSMAFRHTEKDYFHYLEVLSAIGARPGMRLLDFGCSWGYGSWQFMRVGFDVVSFEISSRRCRFARERLKIDAYDEIDRIADKFDIIFSSHVLEHVPAAGPTISRLWSMLREGGKLIVFTPNGSLAYREKHRQLWHLCWGMVHPNMLDELFYERTFGSVPFMLASSPYPFEVIKKWSLNPSSPLQCDLSGSELLCVAVKGNAHTIAFGSSLDAGAAGFTANGMSTSQWGTLRPPPLNSESSL